MRVARYDLADPSFPISLAEVADPPLPGPAWARVSVAYGGICGSDLHNVFPDGTGSRIFGPYVAAPMEMGHEIAGVVAEAGPACPFPAGAVVAVDPTIACAARGLDPCPPCREGQASSCLAAGSRVGTGGFGLGFTTGLGGGWGDQVLAHASQLHLVPTAVDARTAVLTEPLSVALHALGRRPPRDGEPVVVVGAGIIGLTCVVALRHAAPAAPVVVLARHEHQAAAAHALGATQVVRVDGEPAGWLPEVAAHVGAVVRGRGDAATLVGGAPTVVEAVGTGASIGLAARLCAHRGTVHLVGGVGATTVDLAAVWFKELEVVGTFCHAVDVLAGTREHSFDRALGLLAAGALPADSVITHELPLTAVREACTIAADKSQRSIKVVLHPDR